jgi:hypothetical protein
MILRSRCVRAVEKNKTTEYGEAFLGTSVGGRVRLSPYPLFWVCDGDKVRTRKPLPEPRLHAKAA